MKCPLLSLLGGLLLAGGAAAAPIRVACIGDSITRGAGAPAGQDYPSQLQKLLGPQYQVGNFGSSGATLLREGDKPYEKQPEFRGALGFHADIAVVLLGANDSKPLNWEPYHAEFGDDYQWLVEQLRKVNPGMKIFMCRPTPVVGEGKHEISETGVQKEMSIIDLAAETLRVQEIDMHAALAGHPEDLPDNVHPNAAGAGLLAKAAASAITGQQEESGVAAAALAPAGAPR